MPFSPKRTFTNLRENLSQLGTKMGSRCTSPAPASPVDTVSPISPGSQNSGPAISPISATNSFGTYRVRKFENCGRGQFTYTEIVTGFTNIPKIEVSPPDSLAVPDTSVSLARSQSAGAGAATIDGGYSHTDHRRRVDGGYSHSDHRRRVSAGDRGRTSPPISGLKHKAVFELDDTSSVRRGRRRSRGELPATPPLSPVASIWEKYPVAGGEACYPQTPNTPQTPQTPQIYLPYRPPSPPTWLPPSPPTSSSSVDSDSETWSWIERSRTPNLLDLPVSPGTPLSIAISNYRPDLLPPRPETPAPELSETCIPAAGFVHPPSAVPANLLSLPAEVLVRIFTHLPDLPTVSCLAATHSHLRSIYVSHPLPIALSVVETSNPALSRLLSLAPTADAPTYLATAECASLTTDRIVARIQEACPTLPAHILASTSLLKAALYNIWNYNLLFSHHPSSASAEYWAWQLSEQELEDMLAAHTALGMLLEPLKSDPLIAVRAGVLEVGEEWWMQDELERWCGWLCGRDLAVLEKVLSVEEEDECGRWDVIIRMGLARWDRTQEVTRGSPGGTGRGLRGVVATVLLEMRMGVAGEGGWWI